jgi:aminoglycoside 3-N-acetyltransferase I
MKIDLKILSNSDIDEFIELIKIFENVFEMEEFAIPENNYLQKLLNQQNFFVLIACIGEKVVGGLTVYTLQQYYSVKPLAYIYDVGVLSEFQRQGIGKKMIDYLLEFCKNKGFKQVFVEAENEDIHAVEFYRKTKKNSEMQVTHFTYNLD